MYAELDLFSGRPNPRWELTVSEQHELITRLHKLPKAETGRLEDRLGYRGIVVTAAKGETDAFDILIVSAGNACSRSNKRIELWYVDRDRTFERWLFGIGKHHLPAVLYELASRELEP